MPATPEIEKRQAAQRRLILEMIDASMQLAHKRGPHPLTNGCNCITCVNKRKRILSGPPKPWRYKL
ncbi:hypothetical protein [Desulfatitalea alkaliphila]|uniref:Uncharacterized protein n=1 Tax=Desulfatitalea alkaliphila TaxID=2929485 RepID=A0AA41R8M4_9BACT|nr:hypothetical protein [Desulfatitalea alkaliphila]MCJ8503021.1 hypothetical protein [Desulfatitalea alkaliphila]